MAYQQMEIIAEESEL